MNTLLVINSSGRVTRSITRRLTGRFISEWRAGYPEGVIVEREVGINPPPAINESWIAAAFAKTPSAGDREALALSDRLVDELAAADAIVIGVPIYNFGMPASLKAYFDQVIRMGRTVAIDPDGPEPYRPLLKDKPVAIIVSAGDGAMHPGGALWSMNHLEPHLITVLEFIGLTDVHFVRAGYDEYQDDRARRSLSKAEEDVGRLVDVLLRGDEVGTKI